MSALFLRGAVAALVLLGAVAHAQSSRLFDEQLIRKAAVDSFPDPAAIFEANLATLAALGHAGWQALRAQCRADAMADAASAARPSSDRPDPTDRC